ncbi:fumarylacetoacetate hydrolase family protein [Halobacterium zhouii]|uniref:fumarylacetoacetate hydrolase family protein n=1 Tax=Halobacterium zhouii TaxID=2902624 RepID=UPI001E5F255B|nr:fumarylacetoacetate hydrolase family protein [Halobacterium zhouii]
MHEMRFRDPAGAVRRGEYKDGAVSFGGQTHDVGEVDVLPPCEPSKIVCVGRNYAAHADERGEDVPDRPLLFLKPPNTLAGHRDTVTPPAGKDRIEHEAELAVVVDEQCRNVDEGDAMHVVRGFTCANDVSNRDDQDREQNWVRGKAFDGACPLGPVLATPEEVPEDASVELRVNGETRQSSAIDRFIFSIPELVAEITQYLTLEPGDVILTGTPSGVGPLADGDRVEVEVEGVGTLEHGVDRA